MHTKSSQRDLYQPSQKYWNIHNLKYSAHKSITRQAMYVKRNNDVSNHWRRGKAIIITYSECVTVALVIQHKWRRRRIILSSLACPALVYFSTLFHKRPDFGKKKKPYWTSNMFWFSLQLLSTAIRPDIVIWMKTSSRKVPVILVIF
jgi:hypothetical protein